ncbi:Ldh family oxidoreductase [Candidatus Poribacteria bacterium]|nr:Ldh family oxidoreductase [Candidatus Poribacteria bacterium]
MNKDAQEIVVQADALREFVSALYQKVGVLKDDADAVANLEVETDLRGVYSHGTRAMPRYVHGIRSGNLKARPDIQIVREGPSFALLDGDRGLGYMAGMKAMNLAINKAKATGIAAIGVRNSEHFGAAACYSMMALEHGMIGFATTNTGGTTIVAPGGITPVIANNPLSYAIPTKDEPPIVLDMACGISAWGRIGTMSMYGEKIPDGWLLTTDGKATNDPAVGKLMLPAAGPKGYGLAIVMGALAGPLVGGLTACLKKGDELSEHFFYALNVESFVPLDEFTKTMDETIRTIRASKTAEGVERVYLPGEIEWLKRQKCLREGIPIHKNHLESLANLAQELGVEIFWK